MLRPSVMHWQLIIKRCLRNWKCHCRYCYHNQIAVIFSINYHLHNSYKGLSEVFHNRCSSLFQEIVTNSFSLSKLGFCLRIVHDCFQILLYDNVSACTSLVLWWLSRQASIYINSSSSPCTSRFWWYRAQLYYHNEIYMCP